MPVTARYLRHAMGSLCAQPAHVPACASERTSARPCMRRIDVSACAYARLSQGRLRFCPYAAHASTCVRMLKLRSMYRSVCHNHIGHNYIGHKYIGHTCIGHNYIGRMYSVPCTGLCAVCRVPCAVCRVPCAVCRVPCAVCLRGAGNLGVGTRRTACSAKTFTLEPCGQQFLRPHINWYCGQRTAPPATQKHTLGMETQDARRNQAAVPAWTKHGPRCTPPPSLGEVP